MSSLEDQYSLAQLPSGVRLALHPMRHAESVSIGVWVKAGGRYETQDKSGISHFVEHLVFKGTRNRSCEALKQAIEGVGGSLNAFTAEEFTCYLAKVPHRYIRRAIAVLSDIVRRPTLNSKDLERERSVILEEIKMYEDAPGQFVHELFSQLLWPNHPLGTLISGTLDTVARITHKDLVSYWKRMYQSSGLLVACTGAFDEQKLSKQLAMAFRAMPSATLCQFARAPRARRGPQVRVWKKQTEQTHLCAGTYAIARSHPDRFALELLHIILGGNMSSRLFREVREKRGLAYEIGSQVRRFSDTGAFAVFAGCETSKLPETVKTILGEMIRMGKNSVARAELKRARQYYAGQLLMGLEDTTDHMLWMGEQAVTIGGVMKPQAILSRLSKVTRQDIRRVAHNLFQRARMNVAVVGPVSDNDAAHLKNLCHDG